MKNTGSKSDIEAIKKQAKDIVTRSSERDTMFDEIGDMYWMEDNSTSMGGRDDADIKMTISPSARNEVIGMVRLLTTTTPQFTVTSEKGDPDKIENALTKIINRSNETFQAKVEVEAARCAVLYSDIHLIIESIDDILAIQGLPPYEKLRLEDIRKRTPFLIQAINPREGYPIFGRTGLRAYLRRYKAWGADLYERWGAEGLDDQQQYTVNDWYGMEYRAVWLDEQEEPLAFAKHGMPRIPIVVRISDGTNLFDEEEKKRQPFLYAKWKGSWWKRENLLYTTLFTSMFERGTGPLAAIDPASLPGDGTLEVNYAGAFRYIVARAQLLNDKAFDADLINVKGLLDQVGGESTIYKQTLGENVGSGQTAFSTLAMLSQSGRLPLVSSQDAVGSVFREAANIIIRWIKEENIQTDLVKASDIADDVEIECAMEVKLPQDTFRNAQIAAQLKGTVSSEWVHTNLLQINDSNEMKQQIWSETAADAMFQMQLQQMQQQQQLQMQMQAQQMQMQQQQQAQAAQQKQAQQGQPGQQQMVDPRAAQQQQMMAQQQAQQQQAQQGQPQPGMDPAAIQAMMQQQGGGQGMMQGPNAEMAGGGQMPMTDPRMPGGM